MVDEAVNVSRSTGLRPSLPFKAVLSARSTSALCLSTVKRLSEKQHFWAAMSSTRFIPTYCQCMLGVVTRVGLLIFVCGVKWAVSSLKPIKVKQASGTFPPVRVVTMCNRTEAERRIGIATEEIF